MGSNKSPFCCAEFAHLVDPEQENNDTLLSPNFAKSVYIHYKTGLPFARRWGFAHSISEGASHAWLDFGESQPQNFDSSPDFISDKETARSRIALHRYDLHGYGYWQAKVISRLSSVPDEVSVILGIPTLPSLSVHLIREQQKLASKYPKHDMTGDGSHPIAMFDAGLVLTDDTGLDASELAPGKPGFRFRRRVEQPNWGTSRPWHCMMSDGETGSMEIGHNRLTKGQKRIDLFSNRTHAGPSSTPPQSSGIGAGPAATRPDRMTPRFSQKCVSEPIPSQFRVWNHFKLLMGAVGLGHSWAGTLEPNDIKVVEIIGFTPQPPGSANFRNIKCPPFPYEFRPMLLGISQFDGICLSPGHSISWTNRLHAGSNCGMKDSLNDSAGPILQTCLLCKEKALRKARDVNPQVEQSKPLHLKVGGTLPSCPTNRTAQIRRARTHELQGHGSRKDSSHFEIIADGYTLVDSQDEEYLKMRPAICQVIGTPFRDLSCRLLERDAGEFTATTDPNLLPSVRRDCEFVAADCDRSPGEDAGSNSLRYIPSSGNDKPIVPSSLAHLSLYDPTLLHSHLHGHRFVRRKTDSQVSRTGRTHRSYSADVVTHAQPGPIAKYQSSLELRAVERIYAQQRRRQNWMNDYINVAELVKHQRDKQRRAGLLERRRLEEIRALETASLLGIPCHPECYNTELVDGASLSISNSTCHALDDDILRCDLVTWAMQNKAYVRHQLARRILHSGIEDGTSVFDKWRQKKQSNWERRRVGGQMDDISNLECFHTTTHCLGIARRTAEDWLPSRSCFKSISAIEDRRAAVTLDHSKDFEISDIRRRREDARKVLMTVWKRMAVSQLLLDTDNNALRRFMSSIHQPKAEHLPSNQIWIQSEVFRVVLHVCRVLHYQREVDKQQGRARKTRQRPIFKFPSDPPTKGWKRDMYMKYFPVQSHGLPACDSKPSATTRRAALNKKGRIGSQLPVAVEWRIQEALPNSRHRQQPRERISAASESLLDSSALRKGIRRQAGFRNGRWTRNRRVHMAGMRHIVKQARKMYQEDKNSRKQLPTAIKLRIRRNLWQHQGSTSGTAMDLFISRSRGSSRNSSPGRGSVSARGASLSPFGTAPSTANADGRTQVHASMASSAASWNSQTGGQMLQASGAELPVARRILRELDAMEASM